MNPGAGHILAALMTYKKGDIVLIRTPMCPAIFDIHVKLLNRVVVKPSKGNATDWAGYTGWECELTKESEAKELKKRWGIPYCFPKDIATFTYESDIIKIIRRSRRRSKKKQI
jgi:hypothetical protein